MSGDLPVGPAEGYLLAFEEGARGLARQEAQLDAMRSRAGILLSAAAIATSFLGGQALSDDGPEVWTWLAIASFIALAISSLVILWPRRDWAFSASPGLIVSLYLEDGEPWQLPAIHRELALHMDQAYELNRVRLDDLIWRFAPRARYSSSRSACGWSTSLSSPNLEPWLTSPQRLGPRRPSHSRSVPARSGLRRTATRRRRRVPPGSGLARAEAPRPWPRSLALHARHASRAGRAGRLSAAPGRGQSSTNRSACSSASDPP